MIETVEFLTRLGDDHWLLKIKLTFFFFGYNIDSKLNALETYADKTYSYRAFYKY